MVSILMKRQGIIKLEILSNIFFPVQTYLTLISINDGKLGVGKIVYFALTFMYVYLIIMIGCHLLLYVANCGCLTFGLIRTL